MKEGKTNQIKLKRRRRSGKFKRIGMRKGGDELRKSKTKKEVL